ncbi:hypothetical protein CEK26_011405 [Fusarium fujikuroi]|nr:hypothetical protein CEK27_011425 [Fusarium fujikuroi]QGI84680.1 hypothetical protein CEK25_011409 [Fusarium fujikuroi]QGI98336.1 hypothetical protein CEK26_011405 [Fusarium fujikuroi]VTT81495.1 unnamed protein product [Fusarium fujikuroi]
MDVSKTESFLDDCRDAFLVRGKRANEDRAKRRGSKSPELLSVSLKIEGAKGRQENSFMLRDGNTEAVRAQAWLVSTAALALADRRDMVYEQNVLTWHGEFSPKTHDLFEFAIIDRVFGKNLINTRAKYSVDLANNNVFQIRPLAIDDADSIIHAYHLQLTGNGKQQETAA